MTANFKKLVIFSFLLFYLFGCVPMNMNNVVKEPNFKGVVEEVFDKSILVRVDEDQNISSDLVVVSLDVKLNDSFTDFKVGQLIKVYFNGIVAESYPAQVNTVYAILLVEDN